MLNFDEPTSERYDLCDLGWRIPHITDNVKKNSIEQSHSKIHGFIMINNRLIVMKEMA